jgi:hypothetical protein
MPSYPCYLVAPLITFSNRSYIIRLHLPFCSVNYSHAPNSSNLWLCLTSSSSLQSRPVPNLGRPLKGSGQPSVASRILFFSDAFSCPGSIPFLLTLNRVFSLFSPFSLQSRCSPSSRVMLFLFVIAPPLLFHTHQFPIRHCRRFVHGWKSLL